MAKATQRSGFNRFGRREGSRFLTKLAKWLLRCATAKILSASDWLWPSLARADCGVQ